MLFKLYIYGYKKYSFACAACVLLSKSPGRISRSSVCPLENVLCS